MTTEKLAETVKLAEWISAPVRLTLGPQVEWSPHDSDADAMEVLRALLVERKHIDLISVLHAGVQSFQVDAGVRDFHDTHEEFRHAIVAAALAVTGDDDDK